MSKQKERQINDKVYIAQYPYGHSTTTHIITDKIIKTDSSGTVLTLYRVNGFSNYYEAESLKDTLEEAEKETIRRYTLYYQWYYKEQLSRQNTNTVKAKYDNDCRVIASLGGEKFIDKVKHSLWMPEVGGFFYMLRYSDNIYPEYALSLYNKKLLQIQEQQRQQEWQALRKK